MIANRCVVPLRARPRPAMRLFLFHCAGGSHLLFSNWEKLFPDDWEICTVEAPGRGRLADQPLVTDAGSLARFILPSLTRLLDRPFAFFGHSMGGLVAYDMTLRFAVSGLPQPQWIGISSRLVPEGARRIGATHPHSLPDAELQRFVSELGGTSSTVVTDPKLWAIMAPILRADLRIGDTWERPAVPPFSAPPLSAFGGTDDLFAPVDRLMAWRHSTSRFLGLHRFQGGHFYLRNCVPALTQRIVADVRACAAPTSA